MKYLVEKYGKGGIVARVVADSINNTGNRITTFELEYHRYIHGEVMTHRLFGRNAMSSRAVPISKMIQQVKDNPATPIHWGKNQSGMQSKVELVGFELEQAQNEWALAAQSAVSHAEHLASYSGHKQIVNRLLEPFQMMKVVLTATEFANFFWLRCDADAQPEIQELAKCMFEAMNESNPELLKVGEWHTPYVEHFRGSDGDAGVQYIVDNVGVSEEEAIAIASSCCAQVSYRNIDNSYDKAMTVYERLGVGGNKIHASPFEHLAMPMNNDHLEDMHIRGDKWPEGVTHFSSKGEFWSGNLKGWTQYRQLLKNHTKW